MKLTVIVSGTCVPYVRRGSSGCALEVADSTILLDCGSGTTGKLAMAGINYLGIDHVFLSHIHPDHTGNLVTFLLATLRIRLTLRHEERKASIDPGQ